MTLAVSAARLFGSLACRRVPPSSLPAAPCKALPAGVSGCLAARFHLSRHRCAASSGSIVVRYFCSQEQQQQQGTESFWQRIWRTYKTQTKVVLGVHIAGSVLWFSGIYYFVKSSEVNLPDLLRRYLPERLYASIPDSAMDTLSNPNVGALTATVVFYKLIFPVRDLCTLLLTPPTLALLRRWGFIAQLRAEDRLRTITRDKSRETYLKLQRQAKMSRRVGKR